MKEFTKFIVAISIFIIALVLCNKLAVRVCDSLYSNNTHKINYAAYNTETADIVIFGSSRASHHYIPSIISDTMSMSCVNLGEDGQGILYNYALFNMLMRNNTPRIVVYEFGGFDWEDGGYSGFHQLEALSPIYGNFDSVDSLINRSFGEYKTVVSILDMYRYNNKLHKIIKGDNNLQGRLGYSPLYGSNVKSVNDVDDIDEPLISSDKVEYLRRLTKECSDRGVLLIFVTSPSLSTSNAEMSTKILKGIDENVRYIRYDNHEFDYCYFKDNTHLNHSGAEVYSSIFASDLKDLYNSVISVQ